MAPSIWLAQMVERGEVLTVVRLVVGFGVAARFLALLMDVVVKVLKGREILRDIRQVVQVVGLPMAQVVHVVAVVTKQQVARVSRHTMDMVA